MLFNLQGAFCFSLPLIATAYLVYHTVSHLSSTFFNFFQNLFSCLPHSRQPIHLTISHQLCQYLFSNFFQNFFKFFPFVFTVSYIASSATACIYYHILSRLSILFAQFFRYFLFILTCPQLSTPFPQPYPQFAVKFEWNILQEGTVAPPTIVTFYFIYGKSSGVNYRSFIITRFLLHLCLCL